jgi:SAM-dependent methyltransferase
VLDSGCGTGENTLLAAAHGADAVGVDLSGRAVARARAKAAERGLAARFETGDVLRLGDLGLAFDTVIDKNVPCFNVSGQVRASTRRTPCATEQHRESGRGVGLSGRS